MIYEDFVKISKDEKLIESTSNVEVFDNIKFIKEVIKQMNELEKRLEVLELK